MTSKTFENANENQLHALPSSRVTLNNTRDGCAIEALSPLRPDYVEAQSSRSGLSIRQVTNSCERESVFRLRYAVYVEELDREARHADHDNRRLEEPLDASGAVFGAFSDGVPVGTLRYNLADEYSSQFKADFDLEILGHYRDRSAVATRLMVTPQYRGGTLGTRICLHVFRQAYANGIRFTLLDCRPRLIPMFQNLGFRQFMPMQLRMGRYVACPMLICIADREYLAAIRSPLLRELADLPEDSSASRFYRKEICPRLSDEQNDNVRSMRVC